MPTGFTIMSAVVDVGLDTHVFRRDLKGLNRETTRTLNSIQASFKTFASNMVRMWHTALVGFGALSVVSGLAIKSFSNFEDSQIELAKRMNDTVASARDITDELTLLSTELPATRQELVEIAESAAQVGVAKDNIVKFTEIMKKFEIATGRAADEAAKDFKRILNVTGEPIEKVENLGSALAKLVDEFPVTDVETIMQVMLKMGRTLGATFEMTSDELAALATMVSSMAKRAARPASQMRKLFMEMATDTEKFARIMGMDMETVEAAINEGPLQAVYSLIERLQAIKEAEGTTAAIQAMSSVSRTSVKAIAPLIARLDELKDIVEMSGAAYRDNTELQEDYEKQLQSLSSQIKITTGNFSTTYQMVGESLAPVLRDLNKNILGPLSARFVAIMVSSSEARDAVQKFVVTGIKVTGMAVAVGAAFRALLWLFTPIGFAIFSMIALWGMLKLNLFGVADALDNLKTAFSELTKGNILGAIGTMINSLVDEPIPTFITLGIILLPTAMLFGIPVMTGVIMAMAKGLPGLSKATGAGGLGLSMGNIPFYVGFGLFLALRAFDSEDVEGAGDWIDGFWEWFEEKIKEERKKISPKIKPGDLTVQEETWIDKIENALDFISDHPVYTAVSAWVGIKALSFAYGFTKALLGMSITTAVASTVRAVVSSYISPVLASTGVKIGIAKILSTYWVGAGVFSLAVLGSLKKFFITTFGTLAGFISIGLAIGVGLGIKKLLEVTLDDEFPEKKEIISKVVGGLVGLAFLTKITIGGLAAVSISIGVAIGFVLKKLLPFKSNEEKLKEFYEDLKGGIQKKLAEWGEDVDWEEGHIPEKPKISLMSEEDSEQTEETNKTIERFEENLKDLGRLYERFKTKGQDIQPEGLEKMKEQLEEIKELIDILGIDLEGKYAGAGELIIRIEQDLKDWEADEKRHGGPIGYQEGGFAGFIPGYGGGDTVPALLEKGEFVWDKETVKDYKEIIVGLWKRAKQGGPIKRFAQGGGVGRGRSPGTQEEEEELLFPSLHGAFGSLIGEMDAVTKKYSRNKEAQEKYIETLHKLNDAVFGSMEDFDISTDWAENTRDKITNQAQDTMDELEEILEGGAKEFADILITDIGMIGKVLREKLREPYQMKIGEPFTDWSKEATELASEDLDFLLKFKGHLQELLQKQADRIDIAEQFGLSTKRLNKETEDLIDVLKEYGMTQEAIDEMLKTAGLGAGDALDQFKEKLEGITVAGPEKTGEAPSEIFEGFTELYGEAEGRPKFLESLLSAVDRVSNAFRRNARVAEIFGGDVERANESLRDWLVQIGQMTELEAQLEGIEGVSAESGEALYKLLREAEETPESFGKVSEKVDSLVSSYEQYIKRLEKFGLSSKEAEAKLEEFKEAVGLSTDSLKDKLKNAASKAEEAISAMPSILGEAGVEIGPVVSGWIDGLSDGFSAVVKALTGDWVGAIIAAAKGLASVIGGYVEKLKEKRDKLEKELDASYSMINDALRSFGGEVSSFTGDLLGPFSSALKGAIDGVLDFSTMIQKGGGSVEGTQAAFSALLNIATGIISSFTGLLKKSKQWEALQDEINPMWQALSNAFGELLWPVVELAKWMREYLGISKDVAEEMGEVTDLNIAEGWKRVRKAWEYGETGPRAEGAGEGEEAPTWAKNFIKPIKDALLPVLDTMKGINWTEKVKEIWGWLSEFLTERIPTAWEWLQGMWEWLKTKAGPAFNWIAEKARQIYEWFTSNFGEEFDEALANLGDLLDVSSIEDELSDLNDLLERIGKGLFTIIAAGVGAIIGALSAILIPGLGSWAGAAAGAAAGWLLSRLAVPHLQGGATVLKEGVAEVHEGEWVGYPSEMAASLAGGANGGGNFNLYIDGYELDARLERVKEDKSYRKTGASAGPGYGRS